MAAPTLTYTLTNGQTADASQVMQNFNDLLNGITDGTKDLSISALTCAGAVTMNGNVTLGNASADTLTVTASLASDIVPSTTGTRSLGSSAIGFLGLYLAASADADTARIIAASHTADRDYTIPDCGANADFVMTAGTQAAIAGTKTFTGQLIGKGTTTNDNAASGYIGEYTSSTSSLAPIARNSWGDLTSISLTAGDWDLSGSVLFNLNGATITNCQMSVSANSGTTTTDHVDGDNKLSQTPPTSNNDTTATVASWRVSISGSATYYLKARVDGSAGTPQVRGRISARRVR
jgi:hypothetical protein